MHDTLSNITSAGALPSAEVANEYALLQATVSMPQNGLKTLHEKDAQAVMGKLRDDSGTGPDLLPARILKACSEALAKPVLLLTMCILTIVLCLSFGDNIGCPFVQAKKYLPTG